jgi:DNA-binding transcriptional LysR family regulator
MSSSGKLIAMELIEIEAFIAIADQGTFTRAAESLRISQPAISRRIDLLEMELGTALFERLRTGARLTDAGEAFLPHARRALAELRDGAAAVHDLATGERGTITLAIVGTLASTSLIERIRVFRATHPEIRLMLRTANSNEVSRLVSAGESHLGLRYFEDSTPGIETTRVGTDGLVIACAADSSLVPAHAVEASDLAGIAWVGFPVGTGSSGEPFAQAMDRHLLELGLVDAERIAIDSLTAQKRLIEADFGIGIMLASAIEEEVRLGTIRVVEVEGFAGSAPVWLVRRAGGYTSPAMRRLVQALRSEETPARG